MCQKIDMKPRVVRASREEMTRHLNLIAIVIILAAMPNLGAASTAHGQEITAKVYNPSDVHPSTDSPELAGKPVIYEEMKPLIRKL
jgi:hypothetical protein